MIQFCTVIQWFVEYQNICLSRPFVVVRCNTSNNRNIFYWFVGLIICINICCPWGILGYYKILPRQHVSAFVSHSKNARVFGGGSCCCADTSLIFRFVDMAPTEAVRCQLWLGVCSFRPPIIVEPVVTWLTCVPPVVWTCATGGCCGGFADGCCVVCCTLRCLLYSTGKNHVRLLPKIRK